MMEKELTGKLQEILQKCQAWVDDEKYIPKKFRATSQSEKFAEKILIELEEEMIRQKFGIDSSKIFLPTKYTVLLSEADNLEFVGMKRELLISELNKFVERCFNLLSMPFQGNNFVQLQSSPEMQIGEIKILYQWEASYSPDIWINQPTQPDHNESDLFSENTIFAPSFWEKEKDSLENESETIVRKSFKRYYGLEIWKEEIKQGNLPIFQPEIIIGRGSPNIYVDVPLIGDLQISRHHAILTYHSTDVFSLSVTGQNPVFVRNKPIFTGQTATLKWDENVQIGSYLLALQK